MIEQTLTEGARRALKLASQLAGRAGADQVEPSHLLWALLLDESRAAEVLAGHGMSSEKLEELFLPGNSAIEPTGSSENADTRTVPSSDTLRDVIVAAHRQAALAGRHVEIDTEHLLYGLVSVDSPVVPVLRQYGLHPEAILAHVSRATGFSTEPLEVDFSLSGPKQTTTDRTDTFRVIDAAANRAREGLRVIEDFVRFMLDDAHLTARMKKCRHDLTQALAEVDWFDMLPARDTLGDVGTALSTPAEMVRSSPVDVLQANFKRVQEAARTLEEFGKIISEPLGEKLGQLRYELYTLEKAVLTTHANRCRLDGRDLYLLVTEALCRRGSGPTVRHALEAGVGIVQVREKSMSDRKLVEHGRQVREWTRRAGALFIMNDRPDLAILTDADGVHVGQEELSVREARRIVGCDRLIGVSTHTIGQARQAVLDGADYIGVGPAFPSSTKSFDQLAGLEFVREVAAEITLPWFAIGGIDAENIDRVLDAGASRVAVSSVICTAEDPATATRKLLERLDRHTPDVP